MKEENSMTQSELLNRVRERGEADYLPEDDGPLSCCDEFLTPVHHSITTAPVRKGGKK